MSDNSIINLYGGFFFSTVAGGNSALNIFGGSANQINLKENAILNIYGHNLTKTDMGGGNYTLSGTLLDGTDIAGELLVEEENNDRNVHLNNVPNSVPEPGAFALLVGFGVTATGFLRRRARR